MTIQRKDIADARVLSGNNAKNEGRIPNGKWWCDLLLFCFLFLFFFFLCTY